MAIEFYSPNKLKTGGALFVTAQVEDQAVYFNLIQQTDWNDETKKGSFIDGQRLNLKLSPDEMCEVIRAARAKGNWKFYHTNDGDPTTGSFNYYQSKDDAGKVTREGYGLTVNRGKLQIKIGFNLGSALRLALFMETVLKAIFQKDMADEATKRAEYYKKKNQEKAKTPPPKVEAPVEQAVPEPPAEEDGSEVF